ncbi:MAG: EamA family transporter [Clostridia bacterium]|nr:EamA family transporter [Clostridia bacterium]
MNIIPALLLTLSAILAACKNILIKSFSGFSIKNKEFFGLQAIIFGAGSVILLFINIFDFHGIALKTVICAMFYGLLLVCGQWLYTVALTNGKTGICATVYAFGFVIPTLSGAIFWSEKITIFGALGILTVIPVLIISGLNKNQNNTSASKSYIIPLFFAMLCSGGLGIVQKIHQKSEVANQRNVLILIAFLFAFTVSLIFFLTMKKGANQITRKNFVFCMLVGSFFSCCNMLNTYLSGVLDSAVFFPLINIGSILSSLILGLIVYKEKITKKDAIVLVLGFLAIVLVNL